MRGLKTQEGKNFEAFFKLVQREAEKINAVFFLECGEGNEFFSEHIEGEDLRGWLIPISKADEFEKEWKKGTPGDKWQDEIIWAVWSGKESDPEISFVEY